MGTNPCDQLVRLGGQVTNSLTKENSTNQENTICTSVCTKLSIKAGKEDNT